MINGVTLIALVVTIVVLLVLAGITISLVTGDNGLIGKTTNVKEDHEISKEEEILNIIFAQLADRELSGNLLKEELERRLNNYSRYNTEVITHGDDCAVHFIDSNRYYVVSDSGDIGRIFIDVNPGDLKKGINGESLDGLTEKTALEIWCIEDLIEWSKNYTQYKNSYIKLCQDLNFKAELSYADAQSTSYGNINQDEKTETIIEEMQKGIGFTPINLFSGTFDGQGKEIKGLYINSPELRVGFIGYLTGGTIENFKLSGNINQTPTNNNSRCGGIVAAGDSNSTIKLCVNDSNVRGGWLGGIVGVCGGVIDSCVNLADLSNETYAGGICGTGNATILNCYNIGNIEVTGTANACGILSGDYWSSGAKIYNCYNYGQIKCTASSIYATPGAIFGYMQNNIKSLNIANCYNIGNIYSTITGGKTYSGMIIGNIRVITPTVNNCFYVDINPGQTQIATPYSKDYMEGKEFVDELNRYIESNKDGIDTKGWAKWVQVENDYPTLDFNTTWDGSKWVEKE